MDEWLAGPLVITFGVCEADGCFVQIVCVPEFFDSMREDAVLIVTFAFSSKLLTKLRLVQVRLALQFALAVCEPTHVSFDAPASLE